MGQYHHPVCIEAAEGLDPHGLGCGLKEGEQGFTRPGTPNAIVALVCARGGNMPADCSQSPLIGRWAGKRVLVQGDYAEDDDIANWDGPPLSTLYRAMRPLDEREPWDGMPNGYWEVPVFTDISLEARDFLEAVCNVRYFEQKHQVQDQKGKIVDTYASTHFVKVKPTGKHFGGCGVAEYVVDDCYTADDLAWLKQRCGLQPIDIQRVPRSGDWHGIRPEERRVIVNLDSLEYLDPARFGQVPTLAGMLADRGPPPWPKAFEKADPRGISCIDVGGALFAMLCHPKRRGGGDLPASADEMGSIDAQRAKYARLFSKGADRIKGRWRGGHILGTVSLQPTGLTRGEIRYEDWPTTEEVIDRGTDISDAAIRYLVAVSHY